MFGALSTGHSSILLQENGVLIVLVNDIINNHISLRLKKIS